MRIYFEDCIAYYPVDDTRHRGESRWLTNWRHILVKAGHQIVTAAEGSPDLVFSILGMPQPKFPNKPHVLLWFGRICGINLATCQVPKEQCLVAAPFATSWPASPGWEDYAVFLPVPLDKTWLPDNIQSPLDRTEITWAAKQPWDAHLPPHYALDAIWTLESLAELAEEHEFTLNILQCTESGSHFKDAPAAAALALSRIPHVNKVEGNISMTKLVELFSRSRISLSPGGMLGSTLESVFSGAVPLAHWGLTLGEVADREGFTLPYSGSATKEQIRENLHRLFLDDEYYMKVHSCFQEALSPHLEENAIVLFDKVIQHFQL